MTSSKRYAYPVSDVVDKRTAFYCWKLDEVIPLDQENCGLKLRIQGLQRICMLLFLGKF